MIWGSYCLTQYNPLYTLLFPPFFFFFFGDSLMLDYLKTNIEFCFQDPEIHACIGSISPKLGSLSPGCNYIYEKRISFQIWCSFYLFFISSESNSKNCIFFVKAPAQNDPTHLSLSDPKETISSRPGFCYTRTWRMKSPKHPNV